MSRLGDAQAADDTGKLGEAAGGGDVTGAEAGAQPTAAAPATSVAGASVAPVARCSSFKWSNTKMCSACHAAHHFSPIFLGFSVV